MGLLATLRSRVKDGQTIGVMITASHNPEQDNGVKLVDPRGEMLEASWESIATDLVNVSDADLQGQVEKIIQTYNIDMQSASCVFVGMDNRYHSPGLLKAVCDGVVALKGNAKPFGILTTPMLHYMVVCANTCGAYGTPTEEGYYQKLITAFKSLRGSEIERGSYKNNLLFDGSNGVGARKMIQFLKRMSNELNVTVYNQGEGKINDNVRQISIYHLNLQLVGKMLILVVFNSILKILFIIDMFGYFGPVRSRLCENKSNCADWYTSYRTVYKMCFN